MISVARCRALVRAGSFGCATWSFHGSHGRRGAGSDAQTTGMGLLLQLAVRLRKFHSAHTSQHVQSVSLVILDLISCHAQRRLLRAMIPERFETAADSLFCLPLTQVSAVHLWSRCIRLTLSQRASGCNACSA